MITHNSFHSSLYFFCFQTFYFLASVFYVKWFIIWSPGRIFHRNLYRSDVCAEFSLLFFRNIETIKFSNAHTDLFIINFHHCDSFRNWEQTTWKHDDERIEVEIGLKRCFGHSISAKWWCKFYLWNNSPISLVDFIIHFRIPFRIRCALLSACAPSLIVSHSAIAYQRDGKV